MWARSSTNFSYQIHTYKCIFLHQCINQIGRSRFCNLLYGRKWNRDPATVITNNFSSRLLPRVLHKGYVKKRPLRQVYHKSLAKGQKLLRSLFQKSHICEMIFCSIMWEKEKSLNHQWYQLWAFHVQMGNYVLQLATLTWNSKILKAYLLWILIN